MSSRAVKSPFVRIESEYIGTLSQNALRSYVTVRSYAKRNGKVEGVYQDDMAQRAGVSRRQFLRGLDEAIEAGAVRKHRHSARRVSYSFDRSSLTFAAIPLPTVELALQELTARDFEVMVAMYERTDPESGITWVGTKRLADRLRMNERDVRQAKSNLRGRILITECHEQCVHKRHWHLDTHLMSATNPRVNRGSVTHTDSKDTRGPVTHPKKTTNQETEKEDHGTRSAVALHKEDRMDDETPPIGAGLFDQPVTDHRKPQSILTEEYCERLRVVKPGIQISWQRKRIFYRWFKQRMDKGWDIDQCRKAIDAFFSDPGTPDALTTTKPHWVVFFGFVTAREQTFTPTVSPELERIQARIAERWERDQQRRAAKNEGVA